MLMVSPLQGRNLRCGGALALPPGLRTNCDNLQPTGHLGGLNALLECGSMGPPLHGGKRVFRSHRARGYALPMSPRKTLLIVYHSMTDGTRQMADAARAGACSDKDGAVQGRLLHASQAGAADVLGADGFIFATPENLAAISGQLKDFFDRSYYAVLEHVNGRPYACLVCAGSDGHNAARQVAGIAAGWRMGETASLPSLGRSDGAGFGAGRFLGGPLRPETRWARLSAPPEPRHAPPSPAQAGVQYCRRPDHTRHRPTHRSAGSTRWSRAPRGPQGRVWSSTTDAWRHWPPCSHIAAPGLPRFSLRPAAN